MSTLDDDWITAEAQPQARTLQQVEYHHSIMVQVRDSGSKKLELLEGSSAWNKVILSSYGIENRIENREQRWYLQSYCSPLDAVL